MTESCVERRGVAVTTDVSQTSVAAGLSDTGTARCDAGSYRPDDIPPEFNVVQHADHQLLGRRALNGRDLTTTGQPAPCSVETAISF